MKVFSLVITAVILFSSGWSLAQERETGPVLRPRTGEWDHVRNRAIAFAAVVASEAGYEAATWKAVQPFGWCSSRLEPLPEPGFGMEQDGAEDECIWQVNFILAYKLYVCETGEAFISRSGISVSLTGPGEGDVSTFDEGDICEWLVEPRPLPSLPMPKDGMNANRELPIAIFKK